MPRLVITNSSGSDISVGDTDGFGRAFTIPSAGLTIDLNDTHFQKATKQLDNLVTLGRIAYTVGENPNVPDSEEAYGPAKARVVSLGAPAAKGTTNVHAAIRGDTSVAAVTSGLTNPDVPRNLRVVFGATHYDGGNVTVVGTDQFNKAVTETFTGTAGSTQVGVKIFKTVTSVAHATLGTDADVANTYSVGTGDKLGMPIKLADTIGLLFADGVGEAVTWDATYHAATTTTVPNGTHAFKTIVNE